MKVKFLKIRTKKDKRGDLGIIEYKSLPFKIKRTYYLYNMPINARRAGHAHKKLNQLLICLNGKSIIKLSNGKKSLSILLKKNSNKGLWLKPGIWREINNLDKETVLMVLASDKYKETDYLRKYDMFLKYIQKI